MSQIILKPFQTKAVAELKDTFLTLWKKPNLGNSIVFQSPTGSGKTVMMAEFLRDMTADPRFTNSDVAYIWITNSDDLAMQSKNKLWKYYNGAGEITLLTSTDVKDGKLYQNSVFFVNWQKLVQSRANMRPLILRTEGENNTTFDEYLANTHNENREIVLIIDEEHIASNTILANDLVQNIIKPRIILGVSATPQGTGARVEVKREKVVAAGLIKEKTVFQTAEDLQHSTETDQDKILLELAFNKRIELVEKYKELGICEKVNPLVLIQLPNDDEASRETNATTKLEIVKVFLKDKGITDDEIAIWLSTTKENLENIEKNDSNVSFLLFKQAAATGWDCPRASILVMFREIQTPVFAIQTVGRILRMPLGEHFSKPELNRGYLYTNYTRNEVLVGYGNNTIGQNRPAILHSYRKNDITPIELESTAMSRTDYNTLLSSFEFTFGEVAAQYFQITEDTILEESLQKLLNKGLDTKPSVKNNLIVDVEIDDYDNFIQELKATGSEEQHEMSQNDVERIYNLLCFQVLAKQTDENKKYAPEKSYGRLKTALNVWFEKFYQSRGEWYRVIVKDLRKLGNSVLAKVIDVALEKYRPIQESEVGKREENKKQIVALEIPPTELSYTDLFEEMEVRKSAMSPFYMEKNYAGKDNESTFITFLENNEAVIWWHKNGDNGNEFFAIPYFDKNQQKERLFYPDWIIKTAEKIWILDTKSGFTTDDAIRNGKAEALLHWFANKPGFDGGIVEREADIWKIRRSRTQEEILDTQIVCEERAPYFYKVNLEF
jgi:type III restriction enzyme